MSTTHLEDPSLEYTPEVASATAHIYERISDMVPELEWRLQAPLIHEILRLKQEVGAVILAHNYQVPQIFFGIADFQGDSLGLAQAAMEVDEDTIVFCGVHFMAETAKILNPEKRVLIPDLEAGCSLSESITAADVRLLKERYPGVPVVTYVNTPAAIKAESDICCTSANARAVVESLDVDRVIFLPDEYLARNVQRETDVEVIAWKGRCIVHEQFTVAELRSYRDQFPGLLILAHPECAPEVCNEADFVGSTTAMINYVDESDAPRILLVTECSMSDNVQEAHPDKELVRPCTLCPHMKKITLENTLAALRRGRYEVDVPEDVRVRAHRALTRMLEIGRDD
ncbi:MAG: quinolinate synthase NadA [Gemmatimonadetes bacterium]|uniref:Quinolinate synthase n=1 Tax=Candidatus Kutchimonas denitrificans TaxID=3056748 RepID=A0AAE4Z903_9BACT|nr:quinolinate synthase NadA [Gemmatimonadota bacterium]NIR75499.1 quinolinate synthase NadA [Candidatus Kutchimonas denitrificans]NIS01813.1 quinolinate synthase NadA [Gemmatimonadota bacterium]NIT67594.1 quinolinate synthase NadA [Gemmatimonadota bacterium]NIU53468.1 quinolinate synthase NadA [Gemmatimonadota bacterium]